MAREDILSVYMVSRWAAVGCCVIDSAATCGPVQRDQVCAGRERSLDAACSGELLALYVMVEGCEYIMDGEGAFVWMVRPCIVHCPRT